MYVSDKKELFTKTGGISTARNFRAHNNSLKFVVKSRMIITDSTVLPNVLLARDVIYTSRAYATMSVSVRLSVTEVHCCHALKINGKKRKQEGLAVVSIARDDPSTLPGDDPSPRARMHRDRNAR